MAVAASRSPRRCFVRGCPVDKATCPSIPLHCLDKPTGALLFTWQSFCNHPGRAIFPKTFYICSAHFTRDCYTQGNKLIKGSIPTISSTLLSSSFLNLAGTSDKTLLQTPEKEERDREQVSAPNTREHYRKRDCSRTECEESLPLPNVSHALKTAAVSEASCCPKFKNLLDLQPSMSALHLPSGWVYQDPSQLPNLALFSKLDEDGRVQKSVSYNAELSPRIYIRNEPYKRDIFSTIKDLCRHEVQYRVEKVDKMKVCSEAESGPPARADNRRSACDLVIEEGWRLNKCRTCYNSDRNISRKQEREVHTKARYSRDRLLLKVLRRQVGKG
ncbi:hypothetical protein RvY_14894-1 [Ramazzottius varieornatus]|uniref:THAP-type domain-containing protein n=1 Tax=Ramazzottius varieornatus TaxID=947166 RepID=A0A1D1VSW1_RAMVA|nr:hypothetical protein RvY_14894-1 [Ramazzottius varieornatus]